MPNLPEANPLPDRPPVYLKGGNVVMASPLDVRETCFAIPAMRALRQARPTATLAILTPASLEPLWRTLTGINHFLVYPDGSPARRIATLLKKCPVRLESSFAWQAGKAARAFARARLPQRLGYDLPGLRRTLTDRFPAPSKTGPGCHRVRFYLAVLKRLKIDPYRPESFATPRRGAPPVPPRVGLVPDSELGPAYQWSLDNFESLASLLFDARELQLEILAPPQTNTRASRLADSLRAPNLLPFTPPPDLRSLLGALRQCSVVVANDGLAAHLAALSGIPVVTLFGPGDPVATRPLGRMHTVLSEYRECSPCRQPLCPLRDHRCLRDLSPQRVLAAVQSHLDSH